MLSLCSLFTDIRNLNWIPNESFNQMWPEKSLTLLHCWGFTFILGVSMTLPSLFTVDCLNGSSASHIHVIVMAPFFIDKLSGLKCDYISLPSLSTPLSYALCERVFDVRAVVFLWRAVLSVVTSEMLQCSKWLWEQKVESGVVRAAQFCHRGSGASSSC